MKRILFALLAFSLILAACTPAATLTPTATVVPSTPTSSAITLTDFLGRQVTLSAPAQKVVSLAPSNTEILYAIGAGGQVIGRDDLSDYPVEVKNLPSVGGSMGNYNLEKIANLQPDLVLAAEINTAQQVKSIEDLGLKVFVLPNPHSLEDLYTNLETVGTLTGHHSDAVKLVDNLQARQKAVTDALGTITERPTVFYELDASDPSKPYTVGANTFINTLINMAGGQNVAAGLQGDYPQISQEELLAQDPDIIILGDSAYGVTPDQVAQRPGWNTLKAVEDYQVYTFDDNLVSRPGPRLVDGLEALAKLIHPEAFK